MNKTKFSGYKVALACFIILFMHNGSLATVAVFLGPIAAETGLPITQIMLMITFATVTGAIAGMIAPTIISKATPRWTLLISSLMLAAHFAIYSLTTTSVVTLYVAATIGGFAMALGTQACIGTILGQWFIEKRAHVTGIVFGGSSFGGAAWQFVAGLLIQNYGFRTAYIAMGAALLVITVITNLLLVRSPEQLGQKPLGWENAEALNAAAMAGGESVSGLSAKQARKTAAYWVIFLALILNAMSINAVANYLNVFLGELGYTTVQSSTISSVRMIASALITMATGAILIKLKMKPFIIVMLSSMVAALLIFAFVPNPSFVLVIIAVMLSVLSSPSGGSLVGSFCTEAFGDRDYGQIMGSMIATVYIGGAFIPVLTSVLMGAGGGYNTLFALMAAITVIAMIMLVTGISMSPYAKEKKAKVAAGAKI